MKALHFLGLSLLSLSTLSVAGFAQAPATPDAKPKEERRDRPTAANIEEYRKKAAERIKTALGSTDEEWTVLQPLIENVQMRQRDTFTGRGGFGRPPGSTSGGGTPSNEPPRPGQAEAQNLQTTLENESSSVDEVKSKLAALRDARKRAQAALVQAREELRKVLTVRQEAALVAMGLLE